MKLAFLLFIYTGARRGEICQYRVGEDSGLRWRDINWMQNTITLKGKNKERSVPMVKALREALLGKCRNAIVVFIRLKVVGATGVEPVTSAL